MILPDSVVSTLLLAALAAPAAQILLVRWFSGMAAHHRHILNQIAFLCMGVGLGGLISLHDWVAGWSAESVLAAIVAVSLVSALSLLGRPNVRVNGWSVPFTLCLAVCVGFFGAEHAWVPAGLAGLALLADLAWAVLGRFAWELEHRPLHGPNAHANGGGPPVPLESTRGPAASALPSTAVTKAAFPRVPTDRFASLLGMEAPKQALMRALARALEEPETRNGVLLFGPAGNGKTSLVRAACGELGAPTVELAIADLVSPHHGQGPRALSDAFDQACRAPGHTVLFLDEIDAVLTRRGDQAALLGDAALLTQVFLTKVSEARARGLVVVGATNFVDRLDPAAVREGRFDFRVEVPNPDAATRRLVLEQRLSRLDPKEREAAAQRLSGFSMARLVALAERTNERFPQRALAWEHVAAALRDLQGTTGTALDGVPRLSELLFNAPLRQHLLSWRDRIAQAGGILAAGGRPPSGALFSGPSGTGKTLAARALARELGLSFFPTTGYDLVQRDGLLDDLFHRAAENRPSLVFLDEAEDVLAVRQPGTPGLAPGLSGKLLAWLDGASGRPADVLVVAATNHPDRVDPAFLRPGRLTEHVAFAAPDESTLVLLCAQALNARAVERDPALTPERMASILRGATPAAAVHALDQALSDSLVRRAPLAPVDLERVVHRMGLGLGSQALPAPI